MTIAHISIPCTDLNVSEEFYATILKPLGYKIYVKTGTKIFFRGRWSLDSEFSLRYEKSAEPIGGVRVTIYASSKAQVNKFYVLGLTKANNIASGATNDYPSAYTASIVDFDGNVIEAIYFKSYIPKFIIPARVTPQALFCAIYFITLFFVSRELGGIYCYIFDALSFFLVADIIYLGLDPEGSVRRLEDYGLLDIGTRDYLSKSRLPSVRYR
ncbi:085ae425-598b-4a8a-b166-f9c002942808-CDS [Sclerotinia trifoliorum]|uniref:085ae425-598b-4a8a-b166-f9c002942808-CDS n=1 Tax=Sclerotinia trifoliorum TaxID=28548 RepID=A0A8H2ZJN4_9HELO|nr:085ae425-598b-4a8a-b166-f9c002942808-CDS [Sclerotinia trifoliorum]